MTLQAVGRQRMDGREAGFTLLEVVIALTLMLILAVALSGSIAFGNRVWERTAKTTRSSGDMTSAYQFLEVSFGHLAKSPRNAKADGPGNQDFVGSGQEVSFRTNGFAQVGLAGPHIVKLRLVADRVEVFLPPVGDEATAPRFPDREFVLMSAIRSWAIAYQGYGPDRHYTGWVDEWTGELPPILMRLNLRSADGEDRVWFFRLPEIDQ